MSKSDLIAFGQQYILIRPGHTKGCFREDFVVESQWEPRGNSLRVEQTVSLAIVDEVELQDESLNGQSASESEALAV